MKRIIRPIIIIISLSMLSCEKAATATTVDQSEKNVGSTTADRSTENTDLESEKSTLEKSLQGKWKENVYPFRTVEFLNSTVKFVEEGTENDPIFERYELGTHCPFENTNIKNNDLKMLLILPEKSLCENVAVSKDTLIVSGYSTNTKSDYKILYLRSN